MRTNLLSLTSIALIPFFALGCSNDDEPPPEPTSDPLPRLVEQAEQASTQDPAGLALPGLWRTKSLVEGANGAQAWADLIWVIGQTHAWHVVSVYADEQLQVPLVRWDIVRAYQTGGPAAISDSAIELDWNDVSSWLTPHVDAPAMLAVLGIDDCSAELDVPLDTSTNNCGAPFFPFRTCTLMDFADVTSATLTFGDPRATDRCEERVESYEAWTFQRVLFDEDVYRVLDARPAAL